MFCTDLVIDEKISIIWTLCDYSDVPDNNNKEQGRASGLFLLGSFQIIIRSCEFVVSQEHGEI